VERIPGLAARDLSGELGMYLKPISCSVDIKTVIEARPYIVPVQKQLGMPLVKKARKR
jgi:hypothetical protein